MIRWAKLDFEHKECTFYTDNVNEVSVVLTDKDFDRVLGCLPILDDAIIETPERAGKKRLKEIQEIDSQISDLQKKKGLL